MPLADASSVRTGARLQPASCSHFWPPSGDHFASLFIELFPLTHSPTVMLDHHAHRTYQRESSISVSLSRSTLLEKVQRMYLCVFLYAISREATEILVKIVSVKLSKYIAACLEYFVRFHRGLISNKCPLTPLTIASSAPGIRTDNSYTRI